MFAVHHRGMRRVLALVMSVLATACGGGGSGGGNGGRGGGGPAACASAPSAGLGGVWYVRSEVVELDVDVSEVYVPTGLEDATVNVERIFSYSEEGQCWSAYTVGSGALVTTSPSGYPTTLQALASGTIDDTLLISGLYYFPEGDVTVEIRIVPGPHAWLSETAFSVEIPFRTYEGNQIVSVTEGIPGEDDDGDGLVDEADETELDDEVDAGAVLVCMGRARLEFSRSPHPAAQPGDSHVALIGEFRPRETADAMRAEVHLYPGSRLVKVALHGLPDSRASLCLSALADESGAFRAQAGGGMNQALIRGSLLSGSLEECVLTILSEDRAERLEFVPRAR